MRQVALTTSTMEDSHTNMAEELKFHIVQRDGKWCLISKSTGKTLGCHDSESGAQAQERAVQANKNMGQDGIVTLTVEQMAEICPPCAENMKIKGMKWVKLDMSESLSPVMNYALNTEDINGVEIFASGKWNGDEFTEDDLQGIANAFAETKNLLKPYLKIGHGDGQSLLANDEFPAAGWIENLRRYGNKLVADFKRVPKKIKELIEAGAYRRVSAEIFQNLTMNGKTYPLALKAVSILGGATPAVSTLKDILALYSADFESARAFTNAAEIKIYDLERSALKSQTEANMAQEEVVKEMQDLQKKYDESQARIVSLEAELKTTKETDLEKVKKDFVESEAKVQELNKKLEAETKRADESEGKIQKFALEKRQADVKLKVESLVKANKISPAQKDFAEKLLMGEKKFSVNGKEIQSTEEAIVAFMEAGPELSLTQRSTSDAGRAVRGPQDELNVDLDIKAKKYAEENKTSYKEALITVSREAK